jgi:hypothetical protein
VALKVIAAYEGLDLPLGPSARSEEAR